MPGVAQPHGAHTHTHTHSTLQLTLTESHIKPAPSPTSAFLCAQSHTGSAPSHSLTSLDCPAHTPLYGQTAASPGTGSWWGLGLLYATKPHAPRCPAGSAPSISPLPHPGAPRQEKAQLWEVDAGSGGEKKESFRGGRGQESGQLPSYLAMKRQGRRTGKGTELPSHPTAPHLFIEKDPQLRNNLPSRPPHAVLTALGATGAPTACNKAPPTQTCSSLSLARAKGSRG